MAIGQDFLRRPQVLILQGFQALRRQTFHLFITVSFRKIDIFGILKAVEQLHFQPIGDIGPGGQPYPMDNHSGSLLSILFHFPHTDGGRNGRIEGFTSGIHRDNQFRIGIFQHFGTNASAFTANDHCHFG